MVRLGDRKILSYLVYGANIAIGNAFGGLVGAGARVAEDTGLIQENHPYTNLARATVGGFAALDSINSGMAFLNSPNLQTAIYCAANAALSVVSLRDSTYLSNPRNFGTDVKNLVGKVRSKFR
jgi:hypothetical protein